MNVLVTGGTGFIGRHVVRELNSRGVSVTATTRNSSNCDLKKLRNVRLIEYRLGTEDKFLASLEQRFDCAVHLAWQGLPDYKDPIHLKANVDSSYRLITGLVDTGVNRILVAGTCLEYGMHEGCLREDTATEPTTPYGMAKDKLRKLLQELQAETEFSLIWARLFYMYGPGQNPNSLVAALEQAIENGDRVFRMSPGDQLRDFLPVEKVAELLVRLIDTDSAGGIINCCSGKPISVLSLVQRMISEWGAELELDRGYYPYPDYEPRNFWGSNDRLKAAIGMT